VICVSFSALTDGLEAGRATNPYKPHSTNAKGSLAERLRSVVAVAAAAAAAAAATAAAVGLVLFLGYKPLNECVCV